MALIGAPKLKYKIPNGPAFGIRIVGEIAVVGDDVSINLLHTFGGDSIGQLRDDLLGDAVALGFLRVGKFAIGEIGIAASDENDIAMDASVGIGRRRGLDGGAKMVVGTERCERECGGVELGIRRRREIKIGVAFVERFVGSLIHDDDAPRSFRGMLFANAAATRVANRAKSGAEFPVFVENACGVRGFSLLRARGYRVRGDRVRNGDANHQHETQTRKTAAAHRRALNIRPYSNFAI